MRCLGIDPGTAICGCSIVDMQGMQMTPVWYDAIFTTPDQKAEDRLLQIYNDMNDILDHFHPDVMSIEKHAGAGQAGGGGHGQRDQRPGHVHGHADSEVQAKAEAGRRGGRPGHGHLRAAFGVQSGLAAGCKAAVTPLSGHGRRHDGTVSRNKTSAEAG